MHMLRGANNNFGNATYFLNMYERIRLSALCRFVRSCAVRGGYDLVVRFFRNFSEFDMLQYIPKRIILV